MSDTLKAYLASTLLCIVVSAVLITYSTLSFYDGVTVSSEGLNAEQIENLERWME